MTDDTKHTILKLRNIAYDPKMVVYGRAYSWCISDNRKVDHERGHVTLDMLVREPSYAWFGRDIWPPVGWKA